MDNLFAKMVFPAPGRSDHFSNKFLARNETQYQIYIKREKGKLGTEIIAAMRIHSA
jgi:hypothetical protein